MAGFIILTGARRGQRYVLPPGIVTIGRQPGNTIVITDESIANSHLLLSVDHEGCRMKDRSGGGTMVNGAQATTAALKDGDVLKLGELELRYEEGAPIPKAAPGQVPKPTPGGLAAQVKKTGPRFEEILAEQKQLKKKIIFDIELGPILLWGSLAVLALAGVWAAFHPKPIEKKTRTEKKGVGAVGAYVPGTPGAPDVKSPGTSTPEAEPDRPNAPLGFAVAPEPPRLPYSLPVGAAKPGGGSGKIYFTSQSGGQAAVDAAQEGDAVVFDAPGGDIIVSRPIKDVQFIGGGAAWELRADLAGCQFLWHTPTRFTQTAGKMERCAFFRSHGPATQLTHADGVSFYYAGATVLAGESNSSASTPQLWLRGFVRGVTIHKPVITGPDGERRWDMNWPPVVRVQAEDLAGHGHNTYLLSPHVRGQTAWTPFHVVRATGLTFAHASSEGGTWADPVLEVDYGVDCAIVCTALAGRSDAATAGYLRQPEMLKYFDHEEPGQNHAAAPYRGAAIYLGGQRNRIIGQGGLKLWSLGRRAALPGMHFADGIVACDPFLQEWSSAQGGLNANFAEPVNIFQVQPRANGPVYNATTRVMRVRFPVLGANLAQPVLVAIEDLRAPPPLLFGKKFGDFTGKSAAAIQRALDAGENVYLGPGDYAFTRPVTNGCIWGAGMDKTILTWPTNTDCSQRDCKGFLNLTARGGRYGHNSQAGEGGPTNTATALFLRVRFDGQSQAGVTVHSVVDQSYQDCEFINSKLGFTHGHDRTRGVFYSERGPSAGPVITRLDIVNCTFRNLTDRAIDLKPGAAQTGAIAIHNCLFEDIAETAVRLTGGEALLVQKCSFRRVGKESSPGAVIEAQGQGAVVLSHLDIDNKDFPGSPIGILVNGLATVSNCSVRGVPRSLVSRTAMTVDHVDAGEGNFELPYGSYVTTSTFKNADVKKGAMLVKEASQGESISLQAGVQPLDTTPPSAVPGVKVEIRSDGHYITWKTARDLESGIVGYLVYAGGRLIYRTPFQYDPGDSAATPVMTRVIPTEYLDTSRAAETYVVRAINGANLMSGGGQAPLPRWGPMRAVFKDRGSNVLNVVEVTYKNRTPGIVDGKGRKLSAFELRRQGVPDECYIEARPAEPESAAAR